MYSKTVDLSGEWQVIGTSLDNKKIELTGTVPGSALNDIVKNNIKKADGGIFYRDNDKLFSEYENYSFVYTKTFEITEIPENPILFFGRLDTYCDIYLNDKYVAYCQNGNISYEFDIADMLEPGENKLEVYFYSPALRVWGRKPMPGAFTNERMHTRRTQCSYSWDWTARFLTCGISGEVYIKSIPSEQYIKDTYINTERIFEDAAIVSADVEFANYKNGETFDFLICDGEKTVASDKAYCNYAHTKLHFTVNKPKLWYPLGHGGQNLYSFVVKKDDKVIYQTEFGIRTVDILEIRDEEGSENYKNCIELKKTKFAQSYDKNTEFSSFWLLINGRKIMCKGANWVPCEPFCTGNNDKRITEILELAAAAGVNMIRIWGGGQFESEHFYDECTRLGIMVTQDFLMACGKYPEGEQWFLEELKIEAEYISKLIRNKPCLVWWTGDNENAIDHQKTEKDYRGRSSAYLAIAPVIYKNDPNRRFLHSSPYGGALFGSNTVGTSHNTQFMGYMFQYFEGDDVSGYKDMFKDFKGRFIAEEPTMGAASYNSLKRFMTDEDIFGDNEEMWLYHTKNNPYLKKQLFHNMADFAEKVLGEFKDGHDRLFKYQYVQYEWVRLSLEQARRDKWFSSGVIFWMLNDCWPAASGWALIDYYTKPKASYYSFKRTAKPCIAALDLEDKKYTLYICNDGEAKSAEIKLYKMSENPVDLETIYNEEIEIKENISYPIYNIDEAEIKDGEFLIADVLIDGKVIDRAFYRKGILDLKPCDDITVDTEPSPCGGSLIKIKADSYIHSVCIETDEVLSDNYFSLLPGEERYIEVADTENIKVIAYTL